MKPHILIVHYSQTGQLSAILKSLASELAAHASIEWQEIRPVKPFPFPWTKYVFFDCMPECVLEIPEEIQEIRPGRTNYDLVILGYQPWFLSPSIPMNSFLQSPAASVLRNTPVITVLGARNMWLNAQERIKARLLTLGAHLKGHIVLRDKHPNLTSLLTVIRWSFKGRKEAGKWLPEAGVSAPDIAECRRFAAPILQFLKSGGNLQQELLHAGAIDLDPALVVLEKRGITNFRKFAPWIRQKGPRGASDRQPRVKLFSRLLLTGIFILSPISNLTARMSMILNRKKLASEVEYFRGISYRENAI